MAQQIVEGCRAVGQFAEVAACPTEELLHPDVVHQLFEHRCALGVGDAVKVLTGGVQIRDVSIDRMGGGELIGGVGPCLASHRKAHPGVGELGGCLAGMSTHVLGEGLLEPVVVPPLGGDEVSEPHVGHLVQDRVGTLGELGPGRFLTKQVPLGEGDTSRVLHGSEVVLRHEDLVVLAPRVGVVECPVVELQPLAGDVEDVLIVQVLFHRRAAQQAQLDGLCPVRGGPRARASHIGSCGDGREVGGHARGEAEVVQDAAIVQGLGVVMHLIANDSPVRGGDDVNVEVCLEIGLFEDGVGVPGVSRFEMRVEVGVAVGGIDETVQPSPGMGVRQARRDLDDVLAPIQPAQHDPGSVVLDRNRLVIDEHGLDLGVEQVQEGLGDL